MSLETTVTRPTAAERFYAEIFERMARQGQIEKPEGGFEKYLAEHFRPRAGDFYEIRANLKAVCEMYYEESRFLIQYFGFCIGGAETKEQLARTCGVPLVAVRRSISDAEEKIIANEKMLQYLRELHPEAWPKAS